MTIRPTGVRANAPFPRRYATAEDPDGNDYNSMVSTLNPRLLVPLQNMGFCP